MIPDLRSSRGKSTTSKIGFYHGNLEERLTGGTQRTTGLMVRYEVHSPSFQQLPKTAPKTLLKLYNKIWVTGNFPTAWRHAIILPVLKQGKDPKNPTSYRPISLTSTLCKICENKKAVL